MRTAAVLLIVVVGAAGCAGTPAPDDPELFPTPPTTREPATTTRGDSVPPDPEDETGVDIEGRVSSVRTALLSLGLQASVSYDEEAGRVVALVAGPTVYNNAELAELIISIAGDSDQPGAVEITHSELTVRIRRDPSVDQPCTCGFK